MATEVTVPSATTKPRASPRSEDFGESIAVKVLKLSPEAQRVSIMPGGGVSSIAASDRPGVDRVDILFFPRVRCFRVSIRPSDTGKAPTVRYVHETWASWEPLE